MDEFDDVIFALAVILVVAVYGFANALNLI